MLLKCENCGKLFDESDPDITQDAVDDPEFLVTCERPTCIDAGFLLMGWAPQLAAFRED